MSGGRLIVLDRLGRDVKAFPLEEGLATIGSDPACDIRVMLPTVSPHHATVIVHSNQTVVRSESAEETLVNGAVVSVAALRHGDELTVGGRILRWEYTEPNRPRPLAPQPALARRAPRARARRRASAPGPRAPPPPPPPRTSTPGSSSGKQVAIVQPQRRDTNDQNCSPRAATPRGKRAPDAHSRSPATKASQWIESRKPAPLRLAALRRAHSHAHSHAHAHAHAHSHVDKIQAPTQIDHTKQAAIMLMTGHTPKSKLSSPKNRPSFVVKKRSPVRKSPKKKSPTNVKGGKKSIGVTPRRASTYRSRKSSVVNKTTIILDVTNPDTPTSRQRSISRRSWKTSLKSPVLPTPKKSSLKDPSTKKAVRKTESIKFDLSNLESNTISSHNGLLDVSTNTTEDRSYNSASDDDMSLHYSDTSAQSPSPRKSIHSRSSKIMEKSLGATFTQSPSVEQSNLTPESPRARKSARGSLILQKALETDSQSSRYSRRSTKTMSEQSYNTVTSARKTRTLSPRMSQNVEAYSIVDLVSIDSNESQRSIYNSIDSISTLANYDTPQTIARKTRSTNILGSSTPYDNKTATVNASPETSRNSSISRVSTRRSASMTTPENSHNITLNSTKISKARSSRSRINDSDILLVEDDNDSPKSSRRNKFNISTPVPKNISVTPPRSVAPPDPTTPVLSIQSLLDQSASSHTSNHSPNTRRNPKRKTIAGNVSENKKLKLSIKSRSLSMTSRRSQRARKSPPSTGKQEDEVVTPKSAVKLVQEGVKNKHSTAKKPTSKRSIIDNLNESDFVKQLFNSPVKRKLSQSMTEFSRKQLFEDEEAAPPRRARHTIAATGGSDTSLIELENNETAAFTPDRFVSPLSSPGNSPNLSGIRRLFRKNTPENDLRDVRGVKSLLRTPRNKKVQDDLTNVSGVKRMFGKSPRNRLSDVGVKEVFAPPPKNDLRRVSGVKALFQTGRKARSPKNSLEDVRGVKKLFKKNSPRNDLRNVSGVKRALRVNSPRNDLSDVRGVKQLYREQAQKNYLSDISGLEELFDEPSTLDSTFDQLMGKPRVRSYAKANSYTKVITPAKQARNAKSLHDSIDQITNNVEEWLESELKKRMETHKPTPKKSQNKTNLTRELQKLSTATVEGNTPLRSSRVRNSTLIKIQLDATGRQKSASEVYSAHTLPIKKRSLVDFVNKSGNEVKNKLPIKKRTVLHSTPVKGGSHLTMNASELGRVSPIAVDDRAQDITTGMLQLQKESPKQNPTRGRKLKLPEIPNPEALLQPSPPRTHAKSTSEPSPKPVRATRGRKTKAIPTTNTKKRRSSIVITKKPPVMSAKSNLKTKHNVQTEETSPVRPRATRQKREAQSKVATPKSTRSKKVSLVVSKHSRQLKPRATRNTKSPEEENEVKTRRSRKITVNTTDKSIKEIQHERGTRRGRKPEVEKPIELQEPIRRGRRKNVTVEETKVTVNNRGRRTRGKTESQTSVEVEAEKSTSRRARKALEIVVPETTKAKSGVESQPERGSRRAKKIEAVKPVDAQEPIKRGRRKNVTIEEPKVDVSNRGRKTRAKIETQSSVEVVDAEKSTNTRTRKVPNKVDQVNKDIAPNKGTRKVQEKAEESGKGDASTNTRETRTRGRKAKDNSEVPDNTGKVAKGKAAKVESDEEISNRGRRGPGRVNKHIEDAVEEVKINTRRVKKAAVEKEAPKNAKEGKGRKRKIAIEEPAKDVVEKKRRARALVQPEVSAAALPASSGRRR